MTKLKIFSIYCLLIGDRLYNKSDLKIKILKVIGGYRVGGCVNVKINFYKNKYIAFIICFC